MNRLLLLVALSWIVPCDAPAREYPPPGDVRQAFHKLLDRPKVPLDPRIHDTSHPDGLVVETLDFASEKHPSGSLERVPTLIVRPQASGGRRPAVIVLHGTGGNKEGVRNWLDELAKRGFVAVAIDARYHGECSGGLPGAAAYQAAITAAWKTPDGEPHEHPFYYDTCWDLWRLVDYLQTRDDVDPDRIGMMGISMGGIETWLAASVDERIKVAVPAIGVQSFRWSLDHNAWQGRARTIAASHEAAARELGHARVDADVCRALWSKIIPGILDQFDCPSMLRLFADRPLLIVNGELDPNCPLEGATIAFDTARAAKAASGKPETLKILVAKGTAHAITDEQHKAILDWFTEWLKP